MKTLYRYAAPDGAASIRLIERKSGGTQCKTFAVIVDTPNRYATFDVFYSIEYAASAFVNLCERFGGITEARQMVAVP